MNPIFIAQIMFLCCKYTKNSLYFQIKAEKIFYVRKIHQASWKKILRMIIRNLAITLVSPNLVHDSLFSKK